MFNLKKIKKESKMIFFFAMGGKEGVGGRRTRLYQAYMQNAANWAIFHFLRLLWKGGGYVKKIVNM